MSTWSVSGPAHSDDDEVSDERLDNEGLRYERQGLLGIGGMGVVYTARDGRLRRQVALKVAATPELAGRLAREAWITAQLEHPGIVAVYDAGETDGEAWYTMRLIRGRTLRDRLEACPSLEERLTLLPHLLAATQAVAYAHSMGIIHRDLKPSNIMVGEFGETQVADWGLARPVDSAVRDWARIVAPTASSGVAGTPRYMSPEQARGVQATYASDVFCLGAALYELVSGRTPPDEPGTPPDLDGLEEAPPALIAIARRSLQVAPKDRYPTAVELAADLERWLGGRRVEAHEYSPGELFVRLVQAWRAPLAVAGMALLALSGVVVISVQRTAAERDQADANLSVALAQQAQTAVAADRLPEAEVLAAHALRLGPSPLARGVLAATAYAPARRLERIELPEQCRHRGVLSPDASQIACTGQGRLEVWSVKPLERLWSTELAVIEAPQWVGDQVFVGTTTEGLFLEDGEVVQKTRSNYQRFIAGVRYDLRGKEWGVVSDAGTAPVSHCMADRNGLVGVPEGLLVGCNTGEVRLIRPDGTVDVVGERDVTHWSSSEVLDGVLFVGSVDGSVRRVDVDGLVEGPPLYGFEGIVGQLQRVPGTQLILARGERGGPRIWNTEGMAWVGALPGGVSQMFPGSADGEVWLLGESLDRWVIAPRPQPTTLEFTSGVGQVVAEGTHMAVALGNGEVVLRSLEDGHEAGRWSWGGGVSKCVAFSGEELIASNMEGAAVRLRPDGEVLPVRPRLLMRRCGTLANGEVWSIDYGPMMNHVVGGEVFPQDETEGNVFFDGSSSPDGGAAAAVDTEGGLWLYQEQWTQVATQHDAIAIDVTNEGELVYARRRELCFRDECTPIKDSILDLSVSNGRVALGTLSGDVWLVDLETRETLALMRGHTQRVASLELTEATLVTGGWDGRVRVWSLDSLYTPAEELVASSEGAWALTLEDALGSR